MRKLIIILFVASIFSINNGLFAQSIFHKLFNINQNSNNQLTNVVKTFDNGFACVTTSGSILRVDSTIDVKFYLKLQNNSIISTFFRIIQTSDSGLIIAAIMYDVSGMCLVVKTDKAGNYLWSKKYYREVPKFGIL
jgi:hypothetical protein